jgi:hypothetical protein
MKNLLWYALLFAMASLALEGCYYDNEKELYPYEGLVACDTVEVSFSSTVQPILSGACFSCHDETSQFGNVWLEGYDRVKSLAANGILLGVIDHGPGFSPMPKGGNKLPTCEISQVQAWINQGMLNN